MNHHEWVQEPKRKMDQWILIGQTTKWIIDKFSDSTLQLTFKKYPLLSFGVVSNKTIHNYLKRLLKYSSLF